MLKRLDEVEIVCQALKVKHLLFSSGFGIARVLQEVEDVNAFLAQFKQIDKYSQNWNFDINYSSRCHHHKYFKTLLNTERYLSLEMPMTF